MSSDLITSYFDRVSDAPDAFSRLRRFILDLAVRGNLVAQDLRDEPAIELFKRIQDEKARLAKAREIKKEKPSPPVEADEAPFDIPANWHWARIRQITSDRGQTIPKQVFTYIDVTAINKELGYISDARVLAPDGAPSRARKIVKTGDVIYSCVRPYLLNIAVIENETVPAPIASTAFAVLNGFGLVLSKYLWIVLRSPFMVSCVEGKMRGQAYPAINDSDFANLPMPLPPLAEQRRIVMKVDELMSLCDRFESARADRDNTRDQLVAAALHHLSNGDSAESFRERAVFYLDHLTEVTNKPEHIELLRQAILELAVRGRLAPASSAVPIKNAGNRASPDPDFAALPSHWSIQTLMTVASEIVDCPHSTPKWTSQGKICVRTNQFRPGCLDLSDVRFVSESTYKERIQRLEPAENDILYSREGGILGVACRVPPNTKLCLGQRMMLIRSGPNIDPAFLEMVLNSPHITRIARAETTGAAAPRVNVATVKAYPIPLPPLEEQHFVVAKVHELMVLCDRVESQLATTQAVSTRLLESVLHHAVGSEPRSPTKESAIRAS